MPLLSSRHSAGRRAAVAVTLLGVLLALLGSVLVSSGASAESPAREQFVEQVNAERTARGIAPLRVTADLNDVAQAHADRMATAGTIFHNPNLSSEVAGWLRVSENVGYGPGVDTIHVALMNSAGHRANILDTVVTQVGIGTTLVGSRLYVAQVFRRPDATTADAASPGTPEPTAAPIAEPTAGPTAAPIAEATAGPTAGPTAEPTAGPTAGPTAEPTVGPSVEPTPAESPTPIARNTTGTCDAKQLSQPFSDAAGTPHSYSISCASGWGIAAGKSATTYDPFASLTRGQTATFLVNTLVAAGRTVPAPGDVCAATDDVHEVSYERLAMAGIVPTPSDRVCATALPISREEMAWWTEKALGVQGVLAAGDRNWYFDDDASPLETSINMITDLGIVTGKGGGFFGPTETLTRGQMATFLARALDALLTQKR